MTVWQKNAALLLNEANSSDGRKLRQMIPELVETIKGLTYWEAENFLVQAVASRKARQMPAPLTLRFVNKNKNQLDTILTAGGWPVDEGCRRALGAVLSMAPKEPLKNIVDAMEREAAKAAAEKPSKAERAVRQSARTKLGISRPVGRPPKPAGLPPKKECDD